jgi:hypothetical protein
MKQGKYDETAEYELVCATHHPALPATCKTGTLHITILHAQSLKEVMTGLNKVR